MSTPPLPPQPPYTAPPAPAPPPEKVAGGSAVKIILIIVGVFVFLGVLAAAVVGYGVYKVSHAVQGVHINKESDGNVSITTPGGTISSGSGSTVSAADLGIDLYPGAVKGEGSMNLKTPKATMVTAVFNTSDSPTQVVDFYKAKLGENASTVETGNGTMLTNGDTDPNDKIVVTVTPDGGKTKITVLHTTKKN